MLQLFIDEVTHFVLLNGSNRNLSIYRIFVDSDNEDDETKFVDEDDDSDEGRPANQQAANNNDDEEDELDKFMAGIEVRWWNYMYKYHNRLIILNGASIIDARVF